ncbi:MAG: preprotein translocase subunit SecY, partial [Bacillota bacterium]|nr:preprotein translocase subunit SecY [Bacillota bacterium]
MIQTVVQAWRIPEMRKKMIFTIVMLIIFRIGSNIPVPYINRELLTTMFDANTSGLFGLFDLFSGGSFSNFTIFALSITPYITSSIILQLLTIAIPALERLAQEGEEGRRKIAAYTRYITVALALIQAVGYTFGLFNSVLTTNDVFVKIVIVLILIAGTAFLMWLGEKIDEKGVGNGISLLIFAGIVSRVPTTVRTTIRGAIAGTYSWISIILFCIFAIAVTMGIVLVQEGTRKIPVQYAKRVVGRKMYGGQSTNIPIKVNQAGVIPVIFAVSLLQLPATIAYMAPNGGFAAFVQKYLSTQGNPGFWIYFILDMVLIFAFTYFYGSISFNPVEIADNMKSNGGFIPGIRPGKATSDYIHKVAIRLDLVSAIFLAIVAAMPTLLQHWTALAIGFGGTSLIIAVGVALDTVRALETQMQMRNY